MLSLQPCGRVEEVTLWSQLQPGWMTDQSTYIVPKVNLVDYQLHAPSHTLKSSKTVAPWSRKKKGRLVLVPLTSLLKDASQHVPPPKNLKNLSITGYEQFDRRFFFFFFLRRNEFWTLFSHFMLISNCFTFIWSQGIVPQTDHTRE